MPRKHGDFLKRNLLPRAALLVWSAALLTAIVAAPIAASAARPEGWFLYQAFEPFCHQIPDRSWHLNGRSLAVCVRCLGLYAGLLLAALLGRRLSERAIVVALGLLGVSWAVEFSDLAMASDKTRFVTGLVLGCSAGAALLAGAPQYGLRTAVRHPMRTEVRLPEPRTQ